MHTIPMAAHLKMVTTKDRFPSPYKREALAMKPEKLYNITHAVRP